MELKDSYAHVDHGRSSWWERIFRPITSPIEGGHDPDRDRKLLLHRREIDRIAGALAEKGLTLVPLQVYFKNEGPRWNWVWLEVRPQSTNATPSVNANTLEKWNARPAAGGRS